MNDWIRIKWPLGGLVLLGWAMGLVPEVCGQKPPLPNMILVMADDLGWGDPGFNGGTLIRTPHLDAMAKAGLTMNRFYAQAPVCSPTRGSCLTGRHPYRYGIETANAGHLKSQERTLPELLKPKGYRTGHFGKWHLGTLTKTVRDGRRGGRPDRAAHYAPPWENGFDECFSTEVQMPTWDPMKNQRFPSRYWTGPDQFAEENLEGDNSRVIMDRVIPFLEKSVGADHPFFAVVWFHTPHEPVLGGPDYLALYPDHPKEARHYYACITAMDDQIGRLRHKLRDLKVADNTLLFFCSDNGPEGDKQEGRRMGSTGPFRGRKRSLFEGGIRVPSLVEWPDRIKAGTVTDYMATTTDYFPTLLEVAGMKPPVDRPLDGLSLVDVFQGKAGLRPRPIAFQTRGKLNSGSTRKSPGHALIGNQYKLLTDLDVDGRSDMLFHLGDDPGEKINLVKDHPDRVREMKQALIDWKESCRASAEGKDY